MIWEFFSLFVLQKVSVQSHQNLHEGIRVRSPQKSPKKWKTDEINYKRSVKEPLVWESEFPGHTQETHKFFWEFLSVETLPDWTEKHRESEFKVDGRKKMKRKSSGFSINKQEIEVNASL